MCGKPRSVSTWTLESQRSLTVVSSEDPVQDPAELLAKQQVAEQVAKQVVKQQVAKQVAKPQVNSKKPNRK